MAETGFAQARRSSQQRALAHARTAHNGHEMPRLHIEADIPDDGGRRAGILKTEPLELNQGCHCRIHLLNVRKSMSQTVYTTEMMSI